VIFEVWRNLYQSDCEGAVEALTRNPEVSIILYVGQGLPAQLAYQSKIPVVHVPLKDGRENPAKILLALGLIDDFTSFNLPVLVSCRSGISRSPCLCAGWLSYKHDRDFQTCLDHVKLKNPSVTPNLDFLRSVKEAVRLMKSLREEAETVEAPR